MDSLDSTVRLIAIGEMVLVALVVARSGAALAIRRGTVVLLAGVVAYLLHTVHGRTSASAWLLLEVGSTLTPLALWLFAHALFERRPDRRIAGVTALLLVAMVAAPPVGWCGAAAPWLNRLGHGVMALLGLHALAIALFERADDLSDKRRRFALSFVTIVAVEALVVVLDEAWFGYAREPAALRLAEGVLVLAAGLVVGAALLQADADLLGRDAPPLPAPADDLSPAERVLRERLDAAMAEGLWREPGLAIGDLAARLGVPEHRLRALINRRLGYRNFSAFLNRHRIAAAKRLLADPDHVALPVLTIAMDTGYGSLAPFNRAFREATGQTPTDFRRAAFAENRKS